MSIFSSFQRVARVSDKAVNFLQPLMELKYHYFLYQRQDLKSRYYYIYDVLFQIAEVGHKILF